MAGRSPARECQERSGDGGNRREQASRYKDTRWGQPARQEKAAERRCSDAAQSPDAGGRPVTARAHARWIELAARPVQTGLAPKDRYAGQEHDCEQCQIG